MASRRRSLLRPVAYLAALALTLSSAPPPPALAADVPASTAEESSVTPLSPCTLTLTPATRRVASGGGEYTIGVETGATCAWVATSAVPWLSIQGVPAGLGSGTVTYSAAGNWSGRRRTGTVRLMTAEATPTAKTHTATQATKLYAGKPTFTPSAGTYHASRTVVISSATPRAKIRYTTNGKVPTPTFGTRITSGQSITVGRTMTVKAIAYKRGLLPSRVAKATFTIEPLPLAALAGPDQQVVQEDLVLLDGSRSTSPEGAPVSFFWEQIAGPTVTLSTPAAATATFTAPAVGAGGADLAFQLTVRDSLGTGATDSLVVHVAQTWQPSPPSSVDLIDAAVKAGTLTAEEGLTYKVFALFDDPRLPAEYRGSGREIAGGTGIMMEVAAKYDGMSLQAKNDVYPFLLPPYVTNSWYDLFPRPMTRADQAGRVSRGPLAVGAPVWKWVTNGKVKVWYDEDLEVTYADGTKATFAELAEGILDAVGGTIWSSLQDLMQKEPPPDTGVAPPALPSADYGYKPGNLDASGALDIVLAHGMNASGYTHPYKAAPTPTFITIDAIMWPLGDEKTPGLIQIVAHELMHSWQFSYPKQDDPLTYYWSMEATAAWAEDHIYPDANSENRYAAWYLDSTRLPADDQTNFRQYGLYTAFSFWTNGEGGEGAKAPPSMVRKVWENAGTMGSLEAVDESHPPPDLGYEWPPWIKSFTERFWMDSLVAAWNRGEGGYFFRKDKLTAGARVSPNQTTTVTLGGQADKVYFLDNLDGSGTLELPNLSGRYYHFVFPEDAARTVMVHDGLRTNLELMADDNGTTIYAGPPVMPDGSNPLVDPVEGAEWRLMTKIDGVWEEWRPPTSIPGQSLYYGMPGMVSFCRDARAERLQELVVILGNSAADKSVVVAPPATAPLLLVSNLGCFGWEGPITATNSGGCSESTTAQVSWGRLKDVFPQYDPYGTQPPGGFVVKSGAFSTQISGQNGDCSCSGSDSWTWDAASGAIQESPNAALEMLHQARSGPGYRTFDGHGSAGLHEVSYTVTCPDSTGTATVIPGWWNASPDAQLPFVSGDGTTLQGTSVVGDTTYHWNLRAVREP